MNIEGGSMMDKSESDEHWPTSIKEKIQWFPFLTIMEHTANKMEKILG